MLNKKIFLVLQLSDVVFFLLINVKMPTSVGILSVGILTFMSMVNFMPVEFEKSFITSWPDLMGWPTIFFQTIPNIPMYFKGFASQNFYLSLKIVFIVGNSVILMKCSLMRHFIWVFTVSQNSCLWVCRIKAINST